MGFFCSILISGPIAEGEEPPKLISESQNQGEIYSMGLKTPISMHSQLAYIHRLLTARLFQAAEHLLPGPVCQQTVVLYPCAVY